MSDHWETYPCTMGDHVAFITYNHGVRDKLQAMPFPNCARFEIALKHPDERGLSRRSEFSQLNEVEDQIGGKLTKAKALLVGRLTTNGSRFVYWYTDHDEATAQAMAKEVAARHGYSIELMYERDLQRSCYWDELFPTDDDRQVIEDMKMERALREEGDPLTQEREIEHWAYFHSAADRQRFVKAIDGHFASIEVCETPGEERGSFVAKLMHRGLPDYLSINKYTLLLNRAAKDAGGDYDGWETCVCIP